MTKINLIGSTTKGKPGPGPGNKGWIIYVVGPFLGVLIGVVGYFYLDKEIKETGTQIAMTRKEIDRYKAMIAEAQKAKEKQRTLQEILDVINTLRKEKSFAARVLDQVSVKKPDKLHLESMKKVGLKLGMEGVALDDETVANFMTNLRQSTLFSNVDLVVSEQIEQSKVKLKKFTLSCDIVSK